MLASSLLFVPESSLGPNAEYAYNALQLLLVVKRMQK